MRNSDMDQAVVARAQFENPFAGGEFGFALEEVDTLLVRVDVGGYPAASFQRAHRESRVIGGRVLRDESPPAEASALALDRCLEREVAFAAPSNKVSTGC